MSEDKTKPYGVISEIASALLFLTRLPVPQSFFSKGYPSLNDSLWAFPLVGVILGLIGTGAISLALLLAIPDMVALIIGIAVMVLLTGALHEDGLADMADGFGSHKGPDEMARIMKDSLIGSYGTISLILLFGMRLASLEALSSFSLWVVIPAALAVGRFGVIAAVYSTEISPHATLGKMLEKPSLPTVIAGFIFTFLACGFLPLSATLTGAIATAIAIIIVRALALRKIGGLTGDVMGAIIVLSEVAFLVGVLSYA